MRLSPSAPRLAVLRSIVPTLRRAFRLPATSPTTATATIDLPGENEYDAAALNDAYDAQTILVMRRVLGPDSSAVDVGAHYGSVLSHILEIAPSGTHHAVEALPHLAALLREQFPGVSVHQVAVADHEGTAEFLYVENDPGYSGLRRREYDIPEPHIVPLQVAVTRIDDIVPADQPIAFLKIDIEGGEYHALLGAQRLVRRWRPVVVFEGSARSTGRYDVRPEQMYQLVTDTLGLELTTMARWLAAERPYTEAEFVRVWDDGLEFYFLAAPAGWTRPTAR